MGQAIQRTTFYRPQHLWYDGEKLKLRFLEQKKIKRNGVHSLHKFYGKLIPAIPAWAIESFSRPGDLVFDPFCGSGTTLVEAILAGRKAIGIDLDPLSILISRAKTTPILSSVLKEAMSKLFSEILSDKNGSVKYEIPIFSHADIDYWFIADVQNDLALIKGNISKIKDRDIKQFFLVVLSSIVRKVSLADPRLIKPSRNRYLEREKEMFDALSIFASAARSKIAAMSRLIEYLQSHGLYGNISSVVMLGNARRFPEAISGVNLIVTNPPYMAAVDYVRANKLEGWWVGVLNDYETLSVETIGSEKIKGIEAVFKPLGMEPVDSLAAEIGKQKPRKGLVVNRFFRDMEQVFSEMARVLKPEGKMVMKISNSYYQRVFIPTTEIFIQLAQKSGLDLLMKFTDKIDNYAMSTSSAARDGVVTHDWILVFGKAGV